MQTTKQRELAIKWWNELTESEQKRFYDSYKANVYTTALKHTQLTGTEIQNIWAVETTISSNPFEEINKLAQQAGLPKIGTAEFNDLCSIYFGGAKKEKEPVVDEQPPMSNTSTNTAEEPLQLLASLLEKEGLRKYTCINDWGYSQIERDIVTTITNWQKEQDQKIVNEILQRVGEIKEQCDGHGVLNQEWLNGFCQSIINKHQFNNQQG